jgi:hypothetical protein
MGNDIFDFDAKPTSEFRSLERGPVPQEWGGNPQISSPRTYNTRQGVKKIDDIQVNPVKQVEGRFYPPESDIRASVIQTKKVPPKYYSVSSAKWEKTEFGEDRDQGVEPLLMSQLFVCSSTKNRLSLCKYMINNNIGA